MSKEGPLYFRVCYGPFKNKKHKTFANDGILICTENRCVLKDMEGKDVGKTSSYSAKELLSLVSGSTLRIGGNELEVRSS